MPPAAALPRLPGAAGARLPRGVAWAVALLLAFHFALAVGSKAGKSTTADELAHLTAGVSYWLNHDYRLQPENGLLPQRWAALPVAVMSPKFPALAGNPYWRTSDVWVVGHQFFYETGEDHFPRLMAARAMIALFSVATGLLVFYWARHLFGDAAGLVALVFFAFNPEFLAHGALVTSDACMAFFLFASAGAWWWHLHDDRPGVALLSAVVFGLACIAKYSAVLLPPVLAALALVRAFAPDPAAPGRPRPATARRRLTAACVSGLAHAAVALLTIWAAYGFRYSAFNPALPPADHFIRPWTFIEPRTGAAAPVIHLARTLHLLPEAFLYGFAYVVHTTGVRSAFLNGDYSLTGWRTFFLWTFLLKTPLSLLLALVLAIAAALHRWTVRRSWLRHLYKGAPLLILFAVYAAMSIATRLNIGHRHLLPLYPILFIAAGGLAAPALGSAKRRLLLVGPLLTWAVGSTCAIAPHFLAYFNPLGGGPANGWRHLVDSSLDWGQDLPGLQRWLAAHPTDRPVFLSYFGAGEPAYYHLAARRLPFANNFLFLQPYEKLAPGTYCISATMLQHVYSPVRGATWTLELEAEYQRLRALEPSFADYAAHPGRRTRLEHDAPPDFWPQSIARFDALRFARLCHYLRVRPPDARIGYSILIYRLDAAEIAAATAGSLDDWRSLIEHAVVASSR